MTSKIIVCLDMQATSSTMQKAWMCTRHISSSAMTLERALHDSLRIVPLTIQMQLLMRLNGSPASSGRMPSGKTCLHSLSHMSTEVALDR